MQALPELLEECRQRGVKLTPQRLAIFQCLEMRGGHLSAEEVYQEVLERYPTLSFATVYNTLELLLELGELKVLIVDELRRRYDVNTQPHYHAVCRRCHSIRDVPSESAGVPAVSSFQLEADFQVESVSLELIGLCGNCAAAAAMSPASLD